MDEQQFKEALERAQKEADAMTAGDVFVRLVAGKYAAINMTHFSKYSDSLKADITQSILKAFKKEGDEEMQARVYNGLRSTEIATMLSLTVMGLNDLYMKKIQTEDLNVLASMEQAYKKINKIVEEKPETFTVAEMLPSLATLFRVSEEEAKVLETIENYSEFTSMVALQGHIVSSTLEALMEKASAKA